MLKLLTELLDRGFLAEDILKTMSKEIEALNVDEVDVIIEELIKCLESNNSDIRHLSAQIVLTVMEDWSSEKLAKYLKFLISCQSLEYLGIQGLSRKLAHKIEPKELLRQSDLLHEEQFDINFAIFCIVAELREKANDYRGGPLLKTVNKLKKSVNKYFK